MVESIRVELEPREDYGSNRETLQCNVCQTLRECLCYRVKQYH